jgi:GH25 family lysozyme M1 (1,4-beta-N-acetylmuramidase)
MATGQQLIEAFAALRGLRYRLDPPPDPQDGTVDCSLATLLAMEAVGLRPPGVRTAEQIRQVLTPIREDEVKPGDIIFFQDTYDAAGPAGPDGRIASHLGVSLGRGTLQMWDANETNGGPAITRLGPWWQERWLEARRVPGLNVGATPTSPVDVSWGVDVASYQGTPDWAAVAAAGCSVAITKVTEDEGYTNPTFGHNWRGIKANGIIRGAYHFARPDGPQDARTEAEYFVSRVALAGGFEAGDLAVLDIESGSGDLGPWAVRFCSRVTELVGVRPLVYTGAWFSDPHGFGDDTELAGYPLWLAEYPGAEPPPGARPTRIPAPWSSAVLWQYSSSGRVPGIVGDVDLNRLLVTPTELRALGLGGGAGLPGIPPVTPQPSWPAEPVGSGLLAMMTEDDTAPAMPSTWLPLGSPTAVVEECRGMNGTLYSWHIPTGRSWRIRAS